MGNYLIKWVEKRKLRETQPKEKRFSRTCAVCHSLSADSVGPALGGIGGANIAAGASFSYSSALQSKATWKWSAANLDRWLTKPSGFAPGNAMAFQVFLQQRIELILLLSLWLE